MTLPPEAKSGPPLHVVPAWERRACARSLLGRSDEKGHAIYLRKRRKACISKTGVVSQAGTLRTGAGDPALKTPSFSQGGPLRAALANGSAVRSAPRPTGFEPMGGSQKRKTSLAARLKTNGWAVRGSACAWRRPRPLRRSAPSRARCGCSASALRSRPQWGSNPWEGDGNEKNLAGSEVKNSRVGR